MVENQTIPLSEIETESLPEGLLFFLKNLSEADYKKMTDELEGLEYDNLTERFGYALNDFSYGFLSFLFPDGSEDPKVVDVLRKKRKEFLIDHPEQELSKGAASGIIAYDGRFIPQETWDKLTLPQRFNDLVGPTCFHYETNVPGYGE